MRPFDSLPSLNALRDPYPPAAVLLQAIKSSDRDARYALARLWLSEGIPYCFRTRPSVYESFRLWLSRELEIHAKEVTIIGSGRQGFSLAPLPAAGRPFGPDSDLDLAAISASLFTTTKLAAERWLNDYSSATVHPRHETERMFWDANVRVIPSGLRRGFIDPHKVPTFDRYPEIQKILDRLSWALKKLSVTPEAPTVRIVSIRIYRDLDAFIRQMAINLESLANSIPSP